jgi:hypothetical protein
MQAETKAAGRAINERQVKGLVPEAVQLLVLWLGVRRRSNNPTPGNILLRSLQRQWRRQRVTQVCDGQ